MAETYAQMLEIERQRNVRAETLLEEEEILNIIL
jgi:hypothetical protein